MEKPLISVIVPVYKAEQFLKKCVDSIVNQTYKNLEIILVDDGSPDKCGELCDEFAKNDDRIKVIHKENGGQSSARNVGLDIMTGEYVGFVDSDDWIEPNMYEKLYGLIEKNNAHIVACGIRCDLPHGKTVYFNPEYPRVSEKEIFTKTEALKELIINHKITTSACDKLFYKDVFKELRFREGTVYEDFELMPQCIETVEKVVYDPVPLYHYVMLSDSTTRGAFKESRFIEADIGRDFIQYYKEKYPQLRKYAVAKYIEICLVLIYDSARDKRFKEKRQQLINDVKKSKTKEILDLMNRNNKIKYILAKINIGLYVFVMDLKKKADG